MKNRTVVLSVAIKNSPLSSAEVLAALKNLGGSVVPLIEGEFVERPTPKPQDGPCRDVVLYVSADDSEPLYMVTEAGEIDKDHPVSSELGETMEREGVCTQFYGIFPRSDRYGAPAYTQLSEYAKVVIGEYGFAVDPDLNVLFDDSGDDSAGQMWFTLRYPDNGAVSDLSDLAN